MNESIDISEKRKEALKKLRRMSLCEQALSHAYLFGVPSFVIDEKSLRKKIRQSHPKYQTLSLQDYDILLNKLLKSYGFIENVMEKISKLDADSEINNLFEKLSDRVMMERLMEKMVRPVVIHRLERNDIKQLKRYIYPPATCF
jgi:hypothetical protein